MRFRTQFAAIICCWPLLQTPGTAPEPHGAVAEQSRLAALAHLGGATQASLLIEAGDMDFLKAPVTVSADNRSLDEQIARILQGQEQYTVRHDGRLTIAFPLAPKQPVNRIVTLPLGEFHFNGGRVADLAPYLAERIREASGCGRSGYAYAGPRMDAGIPEFDLRAATFEDIVVQAANAIAPTMWIVLPDSGQPGCISDPGSMFQVGMYAAPELHLPFSESTGPQVVH